MSELLPLPQAFYDEFGKVADDRVRDYALACVQASRPDPAPVGRLGSMISNQANILRYGVDYIDGWNQYDEHLRLNERPQPGTELLIHNDISRKLTVGQPGAVVSDRS